MLLKNLKSIAEGVIWPAVVNADSSKILAVLYQLEKSQWWSSDKIFDSQFQQINNVWHHAITTVPYYKKKLKSAGFKKNQTISFDEWRHVPILFRSDVQEYEKELLSIAPIPSHGGKKLIKTSGSTGMPISVTGTGVTSLFWHAITIRDHFWQKRNFLGKLAVIRHFPKTDTSYPGKRQNNWGPPVAFLLNSGPAVTLNSNTDIAIQAKWLLEENPEYILSYPSNISALANYFLSKNEKLSNLKQIRTLGEIVDREVRDICRKAWDVPLVDMYSAQEVGYIALQCPEFENNYHVQSENLLVEVVDEDANPCKEGQTGRVLLTTFLNFSMPLIRYEIGDYAKVGKACKCGRGLPVLANILGRKRNILQIPDGRQTWPTFDTKMIRDLPVKQFQFVQKSIDCIEAHLVCSRPLTIEEEERFVSTLHKRMDYPFKITINYINAIPRSKGGKFEDFISEITN